MSVIQTFPKGSGSGSKQIFEYATDFNIGDNIEAKTYLVQNNKLFEVITAFNYTGVWANDSSNVVEISEGESIKDYTDYNVGDKLDEKTLIISNNILYRVDTAFTNTGIWSTDSANCTPIEKINEYMPKAPDTKQLEITNGGTGYQLGDIIESTTTGVFAEVTSVDSSGKILSVTSTTSTTQSTSGTGAIIDYNTIVYAGHGSNWAALSNASVLAAQILAEQFEYTSGYSLEITNGGIGYAVDDIVPTTQSGVFAKVTAINAGEITNVEYSRETTASTSGTGATITATSDSNVFIIPDNQWESGLGVFALTNDDGAYIEFFRTGDAAIKYAVGDNNKIYKFEYNEDNGMITQTAITISGGDAKLTEKIISNTACGAAPANTTFAKNLSFTEFAKKILISEVAPTVAFAVGTSTSEIVKEHSTSLATPTLKVTISSLGTGTPTSIEFYEGSTKVDTQTYVAGTNVYQYSSVNTFTTDTTFKAIVKYDKSDSTAASITKTLALTFVYATYVGLVADSVTTPSASDITGLTKLVRKKANYTYNNVTSNNQKFVFAYPASFGNLTSILDGNNFECLASYNTQTQTVSGQSYKVYIAQGAVTDTGLTQVYKY